MPPSEHQIKMLEYIIQYKLHLNYLFELIAALSGTYYILKNKSAPSRFKFFAGYIWFVFLGDLFGVYALWNFFDNYETFPWLKNSVFVNNVWWYNCLKLINYIVVTLILISSLDNLKHKRRLKTAVLLFSIVGVAIIIFSGNFFTGYIIQNILLGTTLLFICVVIYLRELFMSDNILKYSRDLSFYIGIGYIVWDLCVTPIFIYQSYFNIKNEEFILLYAAVIRYSNIIMYSLFAFAFIYCAKMNSNLVLKRVPK